MIHQGLATSTTESRRRRCRLAEENDLFCKACREQWGFRLNWQETNVHGCHVCGNYYEEHDILLAQPIVICNYDDKGGTEELCGICCRECYDAIMAMLASVK